MNTTMTRDEITTIVDANKGEMVSILLTDGTHLDGELISINSKGINVKDADGKTISRGLNRVQWIEITNNTTGLPIGTDEDDCCVSGACEDDDYPVENDEDFEEGDSTRELKNARELDALVSELDGATTAELADVFGMAAKELRVHLRALGMGVGKGHRYHLTADQIRVVKDAITA